MSYEKLNNEELSKILGGNGINWGAVVGSCASGAVIGAAFGNPLTGYVANSAFSFSWQAFKNRPRPKKMRMGKNSVLNKKWLIHKIVS